MGQQQILLIVLSVILVGIAISVGLTMFRGYSLTANQDAITLDILNIANIAYQYRMRPTIMGGGSGTYQGFAAHFQDNVPEGFRENANAEYGVEVNEDNTQITIVATSKIYENSTITATYDTSLNLVGDMAKEGWND